MLRTGLTGVGDAMLSLDDVRFFKDLDEQGGMKVDVYGMVYCEPINTFCGDEVGRIDGKRFHLRFVLGDSRTFFGDEVLIFMRCGLERLNCFLMVHLVRGVRLCMNLILVRKISFVSVEGKANTCFWEQINQMKRGMS